VHHRTFGGGSRLGFLGRLGGLGFLACGAKGNQQAQQSEGVFHNNWG
jgi:hypothetical protein